MTIVDRRAAASKDAKGQAIIVPRDGTGLAPTEGNDPIPGEPSCFRQKVRA